MASADNMAQTQGEGLRLDKVLTNMNETAGNHLFDPAKHLNFKPPTRVLTMRDVGLPEDHGVSPFAVSEPFSLFTAEAVQEMRKEIFQPQVLKNYSYTSNIAQCQLRGYEKK